MVAGQFVSFAIGPPAPNLGSPKLPAELLKGLVTTDPVQLQPFAVFTNRNEEVQGGFTQRPSFNPGFDAFGIQGDIRIARCAQHQEKKCRGLRSKDRLLPPNWP